MDNSLQTKWRWNCERNLGHVGRLNESAEEQHSSMYIQLTNIAVHIVRSIITYPMSHLNIAINYLIDIILFSITIKWYRSWFVELEITQVISKEKIDLSHWLS